MSYLSRMTALSPPRDNTMRICLSVLQSWSWPFKRTPLSPSEAVLVWGYFIYLLTHVPFDRYLAFLRLILTEFRLFVFMRLLQWCIDLINVSHAALLQLMRLVQSVNMFSECCRVLMNPYDCIEWNYCLKFQKLTFCFVACPLKTGAVQPEETSVTRQRFGRQWCNNEIHHARRSNQCEYRWELCFLCYPRGYWRQPTIELLLETVFQNT